MLVPISRFSLPGAWFMAKSRKSTKTSTSSNRELVTWALHGLEQAITTTRQKLHDLESQARKLLASTRGAVAATEGTTDTAKAAPKARKKRKLSADARRRIAEAQKRRWAKAKAGKE
jgi:hypothetical protein